MAGARESARLRAELRAFVEENFLYLHPDVELRRRATTCWRSA